MRFLTLLALAAAACVSADSIPESFRQNGWFVGSQAYTFKEFSFFEAIAKTKEAGGNVIELFPGQSVKPGSKDKTHHSMSAETMAEIKAELDRQGVYLAVHTPDASGLAAPTPELLGRRIDAVLPVQARQAGWLQVVAESMRTRPLTFESGASVREYQTLYRVEFQLTGADGALQVPRQTVELTREYTYDAIGSIGSPAEERLLQEELRRDMVAAILRRLDAALRAD